MIIDYFGFFALNISSSVVSYILLQRPNIVTTYPVHWQKQELIKIVYSTTIEHVCSAPRLLMMNQIIIPLIPMYGCLKKRRNITRKKKKQ